jgi:exopolyphosphatase/guanosine-5'-triphosphate,3'-diphosphate pyrophosphatase
MEAASARTPGFGETLFDWLGPLYAGRSAAEMRLVHAACLLHDVNWRAHEDYRAELCYDSVTRGNVAGIDHPDRVFLGLALLNRYKAAAPDTTAALYRGILPEARASEAEVLGRAMRLGSMLSGSATGVLEHTTLVPRDGRLRLTLHGTAREFAGEAVEKRLQALASRIDAAGVIALAE